MSEITKEQFTDRIEHAVLSALDSQMGRVGGWQDRDLDALLPAIRKHADILWHRYDVNMLMHLGR